MYNLIVTSRGGTWDGTPYRLEQSRFGEYTDGAISAKYKALDAAAIAELRALPTLFAYERGHNDDARIGFIQRVIDYAFYPGIPPIPARQLAALAWELDIAEYEMNRTHWAVKAVDLLSALVEAGVIAREQLEDIPEHMAKAPVSGAQTHIVVAPTVFSIPHDQPEGGLVSVMMPFGADFSPVYAAIQHSCADASLRCLRADDIWQEAAIINDVFNLLFRSRIVIVDFSGRNPNVMYETGIAHTLGRPVIPLSQSLDDVPFDLRHHRVLKYLPNTEGLESMRVMLAERLTTLSRQTRLSS